MSNTTAAWPATAGAYAVGDPQGPVAVCVLTSERLIAPLAQVPGVAIAGKVYTANLGIARIVVNVTANPAIRFLLLCGKDSPLFHPGQSLVALSERGVDAAGRIVGAIGYEPVLSSLAPARIGQFRRQVEVIDWSGEADLAVLQAGIAGLVARSPGRFATGDESADLTPHDERFTPIRPGGTREPLRYDPKGYFVITVDRAAAHIVLRHYLPDHTPAHEMRGRTAGAMVLGLVREQLVTQLSHAGYLGEELAKAEAALRLELRYDQDRPLRPRAAPSANPAAAPAQEDAARERAASAPMPAIAPPLTLAQLQAAAPGTVVDLVLAVTDLPDADRLGGTVCEPDEAELFSAYRRTAQRIQVRWTAATRLVMGEAADLQVGALVRVRGPLDAVDQVEAQQIVILTRVARLLDG